MTKFDYPGIVHWTGELLQILEIARGRDGCLHGIAHPPRTRETLRKLQKGEIALGGKEDVIHQLLRWHRVNYMGNWPKVDAMLDRVMAPDFCFSRPDSFGQG